MKSHSKHLVQTLIFYMLTLSAGLVGGWIAASYFNSQIPSHIFYPSQELAEPLSSSSYACPQYSMVRYYDNFIACFDPRTKNPWWVYEIINATDLEGPANRDLSWFKEDKSFSKLHRASLIDFKNQPYDRGHLAAAANHKNSQVSMDETFILTNVSPQEREFNRGIWCYLEHWIRQYISKHNAVAHIISATLFLPNKDTDGKLRVSYPVIGPNHVAVPTHFLKAILFETPSKSRQVYAFIIPNSKVDSTSSIWDFMVTVKQAEQVSGLTLYKAVNSQKQLPQGSYFPKSGFIRKANPRRAFCGSVKP